MTTSGGIFLGLKRRPAWLEQLERDAADIPASNRAQLRTAGIQNRQTKLRESDYLPRDKRGVGGPNVMP